jgi:hypothetical protein
MRINMGHMHLSQGMGLDDAHSADGHRRLQLLRRPLGARHVIQRYEQFLEPIGCTPSVFHLDDAQAVPGPIVRERGHYEISAKKLDRRSSCVQYNTRCVFVAISRLSGDVHC